MSDILFYAGKCLPFHGITLNERPLGGTETGIIRLAEALVRRGHKVTVLTSHPQPVSTEVSYLPAARIVEWQAGRMSKADALIMVKEWWPAFFHVQAKRQFLLTGDGFEQFSNFGIGDRRIATKLDGLLLVSEWHKRSLCEASNFPPQKASVIGNGVHLPYFERAEVRTPKRFIYASAPYRGLDYAAVLFHKVREQVPEAELHVYSGLEVYDTSKPFEGPHVHHWRQLKEQLVLIPGVTLHGNVLQKDLAQALMQASIFLYPATVPETCCISALEAIAAGAVPLVSCAGALLETVGDSGVVCNCLPGEPAFMPQAISAAMALLNQPETLSAYRERCLARRADLSWDVVAQRFEGAVFGSL